MKWDNKIRKEVVLDRTRQSQYRPSWEDADGDGLGTLSTKPQTIGYHLTVFAGESTRIEEEKRKATRDLEEMC